jgi:hypothetical protein
MLRQYRFSLLAVVLLLGACAQQAPVPPLNLQAALPDVSARYSTERHQARNEHDHHDNKQDNMQDRDIENEWLFWRSTQRIEVNVPRQQTGEIWLKDGNTYFYQKLFHADRKIVEYQREDLSALNVAVNWHTNALMIDPAVLQQLAITGENWINGHPALELEGTVDGIEYEVVWLVDVNLPYRLEKHDANGNHEHTQLQALYPAGDTTLATADSGDYEIIDYADLGDRERDPFVQKIQHYLLGGEVHSH